MTITSDKIEVAQIGRGGGQVVAKCSSSKKMRKQLQDLNFCTMSRTCRNLPSRCCSSRCCWQIRNAVHNTPAAGDQWTSPARAATGSWRHRRILISIMGQQRFETTRHLNELSLCSSISVAQHSAQMGKRRILNCICTSVQLLPPSLPPFYKGTCRLRSWRTSIKLQCDLLFRWKLRAVRAVREKVTWWID